MDHLPYTKEEIAARGRAIYEQQIRHKVEPEHIGKFLVVDIETGDYEMDEDGHAASRRAYQKKPTGVRYGMRIGYPAWGRIGSHGVSTTP
jgi:hypothetical protein